MSDISTEEAMEEEDSEESSSSFDERDCCPVCSSRFIGQDLGVPENCEHVFCFKCIKEWGSKNNTCPLDEKKFNFVHLKNSPVGNVLKNVDVQGTNTYKESEEDTESCSVCEVCRMGDREHCLLLCDACDLPYHYDCLDPPLSYIPVNEWFCPPCASVMAGIADGALPRIPPSSRVIPRTKASESIYLTVVKERSCASMNSQPNAIKDEGSSLESRTVKYTTLPDRPDKPRKPIINGRIHSTFLKMAWECPKENEGCRITEYNLEMDSGNGFESIYRGDESQHICKNLVPGKSYKFRIQCSSLGGQSEFSDTCMAITRPVVPEKCEIPKVVGQPKALSIHVKWEYPEYDGATEVLGFVLELIHPDGSTQMAFRGPGTDCVVDGLLPGRPYKFRVRANNEIGPGPWSDVLEATSGAGIPEAPVEVCVVPRSPHCVFASWAEPFHNTALISEYCLESKYSDKDFELAVNSAGAGPFSKCVSCRTPPSTPSVVSSTSIRAVVEASTISLWWKEPSSQGASILSYNIKIGDALYTTHGDSPERRFEGLIPKTIYRVCVQAVNSVGPGPFSIPMKLVTKGLPPLPPILKCCSSSHNSLSLKWRDGKNQDLNTFTLELEFLIGGKFPMFTPVYQGPDSRFKVTKLQELTSYNFRISASNEEGHGPFSDVFTFTTRRSSLKDTKVANISKTSCNVKSLPAKLIGENKLLQHGTKDSDFHVPLLPSTSANNNLQPTKGCIANPLSPCTGDAMLDVKSNSAPSSQNSSSGSQFPLFDELMNYSQNFDEHMVVPSTSISRPRKLPRRSKISAAPSNILDSILAELELLHAKSDNTVIQTDGSLFRKEDKKKTTAKKTPKVAVSVGSCKPDTSSKHTEPVKVRAGSSSLLHKILTKKSSDSQTHQKSAKDISDKIQKKEKEEDIQATKTVDSYLSKKIYDLHSKHQEKPIGCSSSISPVFALDTDKFKDKHDSSKDISSDFNKNISIQCCDTHLPSIPISLPHFSDHKKQPEKSGNTKPSNTQEYVPGNGQSLSSDKSYTLNGCKVQKLSQYSPTVKHTSPQINDIKIKDEPFSFDGVEVEHIANKLSITLNKIKDKPLSSDDKEAHSENLTGQANNLSTILKTEFQVSENLNRNFNTGQSSSTTLNSLTVTDIFNLEVNVVNKPTQSLHHSRAQSQPIKKENNTEKCNTHIENDKCIERNLQSNKYSKSDHGHKERSSDGIKRKVDKDHRCSKERNKKHVVKDNTSRNSGMKNNYPYKDRKISIPDSRNKYIEKNKYSSIERNSYSKNKKDVHDNNRKNSVSKNIHLGKDKYCNRETNFDRKTYHHNKKEKNCFDSKVKNYRKDKHTENDKHSHKEKVLYSNFEQTEKDCYDAKKSKYDKSNKYIKDSYFDTKTTSHNRKSIADKKCADKDSLNKRNYSDRNNKHTAIDKYSNKKSNFVKDGQFIPRRKRSFEASSIDFSSDKLNHAIKRRNISREVNKQKISSSSKSLLNQDCTSSPVKNERLAAFGSIKYGTFLDARIRKTMSHVNCDTTNSKKRRHNSMCSEDSSGCFSDISHVSHEVLLTGPFDSPKLVKAAEQKHSASSLKDSLMVPF